MRKFVKREFHSRSKFFACLLTFCAGFVDAYTFMERGGTLVAGQTGNVVFLSVELIHHKTGEIEVKLATMLAFMLGIFLITIFRPFFEQSIWRVSSISPMVLICTLVGFMPSTVPNMLIVPPIAFCMGVVATAFGEVDGIVYNNSFMTGNIKKTMVAFGNTILERGHFLCCFVRKLCHRSHYFDLSAPILRFTNDLDRCRNSICLHDVPLGSVCTNIKAKWLRKEEAWLVNC